MIGLHQVGGRYSWCRAMGRGQLRASEVQSGSGHVDRLQEDQYSGCFIAHESMRSVLVVADGRGRGRGRGSRAQTKEALDERRAIGASGTGWPGGNRASAASRCSSSNVVSGYGQCSLSVGPTHPHRPLSTDDADLLPLFSPARFLQCSFLLPRHVYTRPRGGNKAFFQDNVIVRIS